MTETPALTITDIVVIRRTLADRDGVPAELTTALDAATGELRAATERVSAVRNRNAATGERIAALTAELEIAPDEQVSHLRADRQSLMADHSFAAEDLARATDRLATATLAFADAALAVLVSRGHGDALKGARLVFSQRQSDLSRVSGAGRAVLAPAARALVAADDQVAALTEAGDLAIRSEQTIIAAAVDLFAPVGTVEPFFDRSTGETRYVWPRVRARLEAMRPALMESARRSAGTA